MNGYTDMSNIENSRNSLRRIIHDDQEFSNQSIINVIERFVKTVNLMEETILIPSRLMDCQVGDSNDSIQPQKTSFHHHHHSKKKSFPSAVRDNLMNTDLFNLYNMLNSVKVDLQWGRNGQEENSETIEVELREQNYDTVEIALVAEVKSAEISVMAPQTSSESKGHVRRPSTVSVASSNSSTSTISDSESEISLNENDSGIESEEQRNKDKSLEVAKTFRTHLQGLYESLEQMTEAANYLTARYQSDIGADSC